MYKEPIVLYRNHVANLPLPDASRAALAASFRAHGGPFSCYLGGAAALGFRLPTRSPIYSRVHYMPPAGAAGVLIHQSVPQPIAKTLGDDTISASTRLSDKTNPHLRPRERRVTLFTGHGKDAGNRQPDRCAVVHPVGSGFGLLLG